MTKQNHSSCVVVSIWQVCKLKNSTNNYFAYNTTHYITHSLKMFNIYIKSLLQALWMTRVNRNLPYPRSALSLELWLAEEFVLLLGLTTQEFFKGWGKLCAVSGSPPVWQFYGSNWPWPGLLPSAHPYCSLFITKIILQLYSKGQSKDMPYKHYLKGNTIGHRQVNFSYYTVPIYHKALWHVVVPFFPNQVVGSQGVYLWVSSGASLPSKDARFLASLMERL